MIVVPEIGASERLARGVRLQLKIPADLVYFQGHFPEVQILPGVVQVGWAIELGRTQFAFAGTVRALSAVKFMRVIKPGEAVSLVLEFARQTGELTFEYSVEDRICSSGIVAFDL